VATSVDKQQVFAAVARLCARLAADTYTIRVRATSTRGQVSPWRDQPVRIEPNACDTPSSDGSADPCAFRPREIPRNEAEIVNPMRGLYRWNNQEYAPQPRPAYDSYERYVWRDLEPRRGQYDFSVIDRDLEAAQRAGRKHAFRIRAMVNGKGPQVPDYLVDAMGRGWWSNGTYVPDWNDQDFVERMDALIAELGRRYNGDPRINWIDVGFYGNWGEWHTWPLTYPSYSGAQDMRPEHLRGLVDRMAAAFPNTQLIMGSEDEDILVYALRNYPTMGWRRDSLGSWIFDENSTFRNLKRLPNDWQLVMDRWKRAPVMSEFISPNDQRDPDVYRLAQEQAEEYHVSLVSNGNTLVWDSLSRTGREALLELGKQVGYRLVLSDISLPRRATPGAEVTVRTHWINRGNAPTYEHWKPIIHLRDAQGQIRWSSTLNIDLRTLLPSETATRFENRLALPGDLAAGTYTLTLSIPDPHAYRAPLALAIEGRQADGSYALGDITIVGREVTAFAAEEYRVHVPMIVE
jgi:hypothetical protein